ncbi:TonB-dependent receptor [Inhella proteolytica]|uniref:TonB-dependent receptor n=1 Tax=Inhella proteolytica TaxID=2795029 RepID=A0A931J6E9_9BURK|nr:TonB-dependent receptor [Inhella proteolytica]MBH9579116.1 TonB-dependent receptor [Inhella proteolytica]
MPFAPRIPAFRLSLLALAASTAFGAQAQSAEAPKDEAKDPTKLEAVVVTATKRIQPLQKTPLAVSVIGGGALEEMNLNNLSTITAQLPTVNYRSNASNKDSALFIRGVGTISTSPGVEPTVSMVLDGVVTARPGQATLDLVEVDRIEILRGPQGTLFGKNSSAGVINIVTRPAAKGKGGYLDLSAFQGGEHRIRAGVFGGTSELRGSLSLMSAKFDGNVTNVADGSKVNGYDRDGVRGRVEFQPMREMKVTLIADYTRSKDTTPTGVPYGTDVATYPTNAVTANPLYAAAVAPVIPSPTNRQINSEMLTRVTDTNQGLSTQVDYTLPSVTLTSITAHRGWENHQFQDQDRLPKPYRQFAQLADEGTLDFSQFTQELRVASNGKQTFDYVAGLFYFDGKNDEVYRRDVTACPASTAAALPSGLVPCTAGPVVTGNGVATYGVRSKSKALFGEGTMNFSPELRTIAGLRYTQDELSYYHGRVASASGLSGVGATRAPVTGSTDVDAVSGRFGPQYDITPDMMAYATYSRGYKGPAYNVFFNMSPTQDNVLAPEKSKSYEIGLKSELLDRRLRVNLAAFDTEYNGYQANVPDLVNGTIVTRLINAGEVSTKGIEMDLTARPTAGLNVSFNVANIKARVKNFNCPPGAAASCNINGKPLPFSPDWKASLRLKYTQTLTDSLSLDYGFDATWQTKVQFDLQQQPNSFQPEYTIYNARVALQSTDGWSVALIGRNLGDKSYATLVQNSGSNINRYVPRDDRRYFGVNLRYDF